MKQFFKYIVSVVAVCVLAFAAGGVHAVTCKSGQAGCMDRLQNPFVGATWYIHPHWRANVLKELGGKQIANVGTSIWLDHIDAIAPADGKSWGLATFLDDALAQKANLVQVLLYDLPNRDCGALASSGELKVAEGGITRYKHEYIDAIARIVSQEKYRGLRIVFFVEPDSLPNLVTNLGVPKCREAAGPGGYVEATQYALDALSEIPNVYSYVDIGHSGWLGWDENIDKTSAFIAKVVKGTKHGVNSVSGFISNTANYSPLREPFLDGYRMSSVPGNPAMQVRQARFYEWNPRFGELEYVRLFRERMIAQGFPNTIGMLIDTSRNGWGGPKRPQALSMATDPDRFVDQSRIDRRTHRGMWCNQPGGIGERPAANPVPGIDAYVWAKSPGESDGISKAGIPDPSDPAKQFDRICDPTYAIPGAGGLHTGAMADAPHAGQWFGAGFRVLMENAWPPLK